MAQPDLTLRCGLAVPGFRLTFGWDPAQVQQFRLKVVALPFFARAASSRVADPNDEKHRHKKDGNRLCRLPVLEFCGSSEVFEGVPTEPAHLCSLADRFGTLRTRFFVGGRF